MPSIQKENWKYLASRYCISLDGCQDCTQNPCSKLAICFLSTFPASPPSCRPCPGHTLSNMSLLIELMYWSQYHPLRQASRVVLPTSPMMAMIMASYYIFKHHHTSNILNYFEIFFMQILSFTKTF